MQLLVGCLVLDGSIADSIISNTFLTSGVLRENKRPMSKGTTYRPAMSARVLSSIAAIGMVAGLVASGCAIEDETELREMVWVGPEKGDDEQRPDVEPSYVDEAELEDVLGESFDDDIDDFAADPEVLGFDEEWTRWYDRDNPSGDGDIELRWLQAGVCDNPTGVECRTVAGTPLWATGEIVTCSASDGLLCLNANQPDGVCNFDYIVRFLCPCEPATCEPTDCGVISNGCGGTINCGPCCEPPECGPFDCGFISSPCGAYNYCGPCGGGGECEPFGPCYDEY